MAKKILIFVSVCAIALVGILIMRTKFIETERLEKATNIIDSVIKKIDVDPQKAKNEIILLSKNIELRNILYETLKASGKQEYFPRNFLDQESFAESDLAFWLAHPNELGKAPDEIEFKAKINKITGNNEVEFYLFRFRVKEPHWAAKYGWMAGMTGPYIKGGELATRSEGTFSELEPYDSKTPDEHIAYLISKQDSLLVTNTGK